MTQLPPRSAAPPSAPPPAGPATPTMRPASSAPTASAASASSSIRIGIDPRHQATFSLANRCRRAIWGIACLALFRWTPRPAHAWRALVLRCFGARLGRSCHVYPDVRIWAPWNLVMEDEASLGDRVICYNMARISLGRRAVVSQGAHLCTGSHDYEDALFRLLVSPIRIGAHAWICSEVFVHPGVTVGDGAVIGARSVVTRSAAAWTVHAGFPCRAIKPRRFRPDGGAAGEDGVPEVQP